jgi:hypothetical protein
MSNLQRGGGSAIQMWHAMPMWGKVVVTLAALAGLYYGFFFIVGLVVIAAMIVGLVTMVGWVIKK